MPYPTMALVLSDVMSFGKQPGPMSAPWRDDSRQREPSGMAIRHRLAALLSLFEYRAKEMR
jgi:hypothetical protein